MQPTLKPLSRRTFLQITALTGGGRRSLFHKSGHYIF